MKQVLFWFLTGIEWIYINIKTVSGIYFTLRNSTSNQIVRIHLFEFEDLHWFPGTIRRGMVDYLRFIFGYANFYSPAAELINEVLERTNQKKIIDLCSGGGGQMESLLKNLQKLSDRPVTITLTDKFPNAPAYRLLSERSKGGINYRAGAVDILNLPNDLDGLLTMFTALHHFRPEEIHRILSTVVERQLPMAIFDGGDKNLVSILMILILHPLLFALGTPFINPFRVNRIFFTYVIPLIPMCTIWDGIVSVLRLYKQSDMHKIVSMVRRRGDEWHIGSRRNQIGMNINYMIFIPEGLKLSEGK